MTVCSTSDHKEKRTREKKDSAACKREVAAPTDIAVFYRVKDHGRLTAVHISKHSPSHHVETLSRSRSVVDCARVQAFTLKLSR